MNEPNPKLNPTPKQALRERMLAARKNLPENERARQSSLVCGLLREHLFAGEAPAGRLVGVYQSLKSELCLNELVAWLYDQDARVAFPCTRSGEHMDFFEVTESDWKASTSLRASGGSNDESERDIATAQPSEGLPFLTHPGKFFPDEEFPQLRFVNPGDIDALVVPGSAFDRQCMRLGLGAGCYDRYLPRLRPDALTFGVGFDEQLVDHIPADPHDLPMNVVVTPAVQIAL